MSLSLDPRCTAVIQSVRAVVTEWTVLIKLGAEAVAVAAAAAFCCLLCRYELL